MTAFDADVLVVGCGPVGVMTALRAAQRGLRVIAIDRSEEIYPLPRALGMDDEIQDLFIRAGLGAELRAHSAPLQGAEFLDATGERVVGVDLPDGSVGALGHPPVVTFDQPGLERALRRGAIDAGVDLRLGLDAYSIADLDDGVRVGVGTSHDDSTLTARWLVAADGAKSTMRSLRQIAMVDQGFDQTWLVVDTTVLDPDLDLPRLARQYCDPARVCTFVPGPARHRRWEFQLRPDETRDDMLDETIIAELLAPWGTTTQLRIDRAAVYRFHATVAERFRDGPVFLAGDAAHQMPPFNGQGMCTGMRDAENLTWKFAAVNDGFASDPLLDTYDNERRPHATGQVEHSKDAGELMQAIACGDRAALDSGYGQRSFPKLSGPLFEPGHPCVGGMLPAAAVPLDPLPNGWLVLTSTSIDVPALLPAKPIVVPDGCFPGLVDAHHSVVVRPDRHIAAVTADLAQTTRRLAPFAGAMTTPT
ncbi:MAG: FAD-dependent monooxygenase [Actinomycetota bacterium]